jgi:hypothetical protein
MTRFQIRENLKNTFSSATVTGFHVRKKFLMAGFVTAVTVMGTGIAEAAVLKNDYLLNGNFSDFLGNGADLVSNGGTIEATGYEFGANQGLSLSNTINSVNYTIQMLFSIDNVSNYRKLIDFKNLTSDSGVYNRGKALNFYTSFPFVTGAGNNITAGSLTNLVVTRDSTTNAFTGYINGVEEISFSDNGSDATFSAINSIANFFRDDSVTNGAESSSGFVDRIRIWDGALSSTEVAALDNSEPVPEPLTILGTLVAGGMGVTMRLKKRVQEKEAVKM